MKVTSDTNLHLYNVKFDWPEQVTNCFKVAWNLQKVFGKIDRQNYVMLY